LSSGSVWLAAALAACLGGPARSSASPPDRCSASEHRQFDFWAGDWDVFEVNNRDSVVAHARVERILEGCALREVYDGRNGLSGQSLSIYDAGRGLWHQSWVTNHGQLLVIEGRMREIVSCCRVPIRRAAPP